MVHWYHVIFTAYGFWLPNDPRGSWSTFVGSWELFRAGGGAPKKTERRSLVHDKHDAHHRREVKQLLKYPPVRFDARQRQLIAEGFSHACDESGICLHACAIGFDHVHAVTGRHEKTVEQVVHHLKSRATKHLNRAGLHPLKSHASPDGTCPTPWAKDCWRVFINEDRQLRSAIEYVERHPEKEGLPRQHWPFLTPV